MTKSLSVCAIQRPKMFEITKTLFWRATSAAAATAQWSLVVCRLSMLVYVVVKVCFVIGDNMMLLNPVGCAGLQQKRVTTRSSIFVG